MAIDKTGQSLSIGTEGNLLVMVAPASILTAGKTLSDVTLTQLNSESFVDITYDLTAGSGWAETTSQETISDDRLTATETFAQPGKTTNGLTVQYVYGDESAKADDVLVEDEKLIFAVRWATDHDENITATSKFDLWMTKTGKKQRDQAAANSVFTKTQVIFPLAKVERDVVPAAGA